MAKTKANKIIGDLLFSNVTIGIAMAIADPCGMVTAKPPRLLI